LSGTSRRKKRGKKPQKCVKRGFYKKIGGCKQGSCSVEREKGNNQQQLEEYGGRKGGEKKEFFPRKNLTISRGDV